MTKTTQEQIKDLITFALTSFQEMILRIMAHASVQDLDHAERRFLREEETERKREGREIAREARSDKREEERDRRSEARYNK